MRNLTNDPVILIYDCLRTNQNFCNYKIRSNTSNPTAVRHRPRRVAITPTRLLRVIRHPSMQTAKKCASPPPRCRVDIQLIRATNRVAIEPINKRDESARQVDAPPTPPTSALFFPAWCNAAVCRVGAKHVIIQFAKGGVRNEVLCGVAVFTSGRTGANGRVVSEKLGSSSRAR